MKLNKFFALLTIAFVAVSCYEEYSYVEPNPFYSDESFEEMFPDAERISIAELKYAYGTLSNTGVNGGWNNTIYKLIGEDIFVGKDVYIKGKITTSDDEGNVYKNLYLQDETSGIELKLNNNVGLRYKKGRWLYVRLNGLYLGNYRMMLSLGGAPSESYNKAGEHKFYANSNLELQSIIDQHVFAGGRADGLNVGSYDAWKLDPTSVDIITVTPDNYIEVFNPSKVEFEGKFYGTDKKDEYGVTHKVFELSQREVMFGRLMRFEDLQCRYAGVPYYKYTDDEGTPLAEREVVTDPAMKSGSFDNLYPSWLYSDPRPTVSKPWYQWAFKEEITGRSLYGSVLFAYDMESVNCSANGVYSLRTSGYSRFARRNICKHGEYATITAIYGIYSKESNYKSDSNDWASYQLTISSINDLEFKNGDAALLTDEEVASLTTEDMKTVPWIDEEVGDDAY